MTRRDGLEQNSILKTKTQAQKTKTQEFSPIINTFCSKIEQSFQKPQEFCQNHARQKGLGSLKQFTITIKNSHLSKNSTAVI